ncbi:ABC transporter permease [Novosphingobium sp. RD2P27]|uniref:ABC transporter permease n=1 Tax=Novosphingobium kalidii TaxID=3230299 RepID=A0ABV2CZW0_9SPHN
MNEATSWNRGSFAAALTTQGRVVGALMMRELHTRYGRDNIGYLWLFGEPLMLAVVIALLHSGGGESLGDINPVAFSVVGYTIFIMFRGIVNRSDGALESNLPLLYHRMVTVFDITLARALIEAAGTIMAFTVLFGLCMVVGFTEFPPEPLFILLGIVFVFWMSFGLSLIITGITYENRLLGRLVHPMTYFMIPLSGAFFRVSWVPRPWRDYLLYNPLPQIFEMIRYGAFESCTLEFVDFQYIVEFLLVLTLLGLLSVRAVTRRVHLN